MRLCSNVSLSFATYFVCFADMNKLVIVFALVALVASAHANYIYPQGGYGKFGGGFNNFGGGRFIGGVGQFGGGAFVGQGRGAFINQGFGGVGGGFGRVGGGFGGNKYYY